MTTLDLRYGISSGAVVLVDALYRLRRRGLKRFQRLRPSQWDRPARRDGWSVLDVAEHLAHSAGSRIAEPSVDGPAVPLRAPGRTPARVVAGMERAIVAEHRALLTRALSAGNPRGSGGGHWSLHVAHQLWEGWLHERDVCLPLRLRTRSRPAETRLVALYGLVRAAQIAAEVEGSAAIWLTFSGAVRGTYVAIAADGGGASVSPAAFASDTALRGDAGVVLDALAGRGPVLSELFGRFTPAVRQLEYSRRLTMTGMVAAPAPRTPK